MSESQEKVKNAIAQTVENASRIYSSIDKDIKTYVEAWGHTDYEKSYYVILDKDNNPYWVYCVPAREGGFLLYAKSKNNLDSRTNVAYIEYAIKGETADLGKIEIYNDDKFGQGLGSRLFDIFEYIVYKNKCKTIELFVDPLRKDRFDLNREYLYSFYEHKGFKRVEGSKRMSKKIDKEQMKNYRKNLVLIKNDHIDFKLATSPKLEKFTPEIRNYVKTLAAEQKN